MRGLGTERQPVLLTVLGPLSSLLVAIQFLTRLPSPIHSNPSPADVGRSIGWFPFTGLLIGAALLGVDVVARTIFDTAVADAILIWALVAITGALHLDGVVDTADGLASGPDAEARLAAMHQPTARVPGAIACCTLILAIYGALSALEGPARPAALLLAPVCGRSTILLGYRVFPYPRTEATVSRAFKENATLLQALLGFGSAAAIAGLVAGGGGLLLLIGTSSVALLLGRLVASRVGGVTGDNHGAICEISQLAVLVSAPVILAR